MTNHIVSIETGRITDEGSFHSVFAEAMGFPAFYDHNQNAWIDCMGYIDEPGAAMTEFTIPQGELLHLEIADAEDFQKRLPGLFHDFIECTAIVNRRRTDAGSQPVLALILL